MQATDAAHDASLQVKDMYLKGITSEMNSVVRMAKFVVIIKSSQLSILGRSFATLP